MLRLGTSSFTYAQDDDPGQERNGDYHSRVADEVASLDLASGRLAPLRVQVVDAHRWR